MGVLEFIREYLDIRRDSASYCKSCETYKEQLAVTNHEKKILLEQILHKPEPVKVEREVAPQAIMPKIVPWHIQRQMLEAEDRAKAAVIRRQEEEAKHAQTMAAQNRSTDSTNKIIQSNEISVKELEKELGVEDAV